MCAMSNKLVFQRRTAVGLQTVGEYFAAYEKRNMLDNADFRNPVNQRAESEYSVSRKYTLDRWALYTSGGSVRRNSGYVTLSCTNGAAYMIQPMRLTGLAGRAVTLSVQLLAGSGKIGVFANSDIYSVVSPTSKAVSGGGVHSVTAVVPSNASGFLCAYISCATGETLNIARAMLEYGDESTLAQSAPGNYDAELLACIRYAVAIGTPSRFRMTNYSTTYMDFNVPLPASLRTAPSLESGEFQLRTLSMGSVSGVAISNVEFISYNQTLGVRVTTDVAHGLTDAVLYVPSRVIISADI